MNTNWNKERYLVTEIAEKLNCEANDIIYHGTHNRLKIAAYITIEKDNVKEYYIGDESYTYSSGVYFICYDQLKHFEFVDRVDCIKAKHLFPTTTYKNELNDFYLFNEVMYIMNNNRKYINIDDKIEEKCETILSDDNYPDSYHEHEYNEDDIDIILKNGFTYDIEDNVIILSKKNPDSSDHDINTLASPDYGVNYSIYRKDLFIYHDDLMHFFQNDPRFYEELKYQTGVGVYKKNIKVIGNILTQKKIIHVTTSKKGGKPKYPLSEAVECLYKTLLAEGNTEILRPGKIKEFLERMRDIANEKGNRNINDYIAERIERVKIAPSKYTVFVIDKPINKAKARDTPYKTTEYYANDVSKILTKLRKDYPLPK